MAEGETPTEIAEQAAIRRRWITLGEVLGVAAVAISGLTFWNSYRERADNAADRRVAERRADAKAATLLLKGVPMVAGSRMAVTPIDPAQNVQDMKILFPAALSVNPVETTGDARLETAWFDTGLKRARKAAGRDDVSTGDERFPVALVTRFLSDGAAYDDVAIYDVGFAIDGAFLKGKVVHLRGLSLVARTTAKAAEGKLEAVWKARAGK